MMDDDLVMQHYETAPEDRIPFHHKLIYGSGAFVNNLLADSIGRMVIVLNLGLGMNPALVGLLAALPRLTDAITDPLMGYISDNTRSRWGRRRPYIFVGAIAVGVVFALLWQLPADRSESYYFSFFLVGSFIFYLAYTVFVTPWVALGYELTPDYHERTRLMGVQNFVGQSAYLVTPYLLAIMTSRRDRDITRNFSARALPEDRHCRVRSKGETSRRRRCGHSSKYHRLPARFRDHTAIRSVPEALCCDVPGL